MMPLDSELVELRHRLREIGMVVVEEPDHLTVRLPYFCSVRIYLSDGALRFEPFFGLVPRTRSTVGKLFIFTGAAAAAIRAGVPYALGVAVVGIMVGIYEVIRTIATESVITRAGFVYAQLLNGERARPALGAATTTPAIESGALPGRTTPAAVTREGIERSR